MTNTTCPTFQQAKVLLFASLLSIALPISITDGQSSLSPGESSSNSNQIQGTTHAIPTQTMVTTSAPESENTQRPESHTELEKLLALQKKVKKIIPHVQECIVSVEGGCGFVANETGLVITVSHVSKRAGRQVTVKFADGSTRQALTLGSNRANDTGAIQLLGIAPQKYLQLADSNETEVGQWCLSFGYPIEFDRSKEPAVRIGQVTKVSPDRIITDCLIMGGDSGGPLVNLDGKVFAINSGVTTSLKSNLHVPATVFNEDRQNILAGMDVNRSRSPIQKIYFGVLGETDAERVRIRRVFKDSPAAAAGIEKDDVILSLNGQNLASFKEFLNLLDKHQPGDSVFTRVNRFGQVLNLVVQLQ